MPTAPTRFHRAWLVAAATLATLVAAAAFRSSIGVMIEPFEREFGWSRTTTSGAVTLNLVLYGLTAPFAAAAMERWGLRKVAVGALVTIAAASAGTTLMTSAWQLYLLWGLMIGTATGSIAVVFGAIVANRWFATHRGLVTGMFSAASATGQLLFLPLIARTVDGPGWRYAAIGVAELALVVAVAVAFLLDDYPANRGLPPYGASVVQPPPPPPPGGAAGLVRTAIGGLVEGSRHWAFWGLVIGFWVCGWSTNGLIQTHLVPAAHDHGMPTTTAAGLLAVVGIFDIVGTLASGWLTDRVDPRILLAIYYTGRGLSLLMIDQLLAPSVQPPMWLFIVFYGLDWVATVPPTVALCREHFGLERSGVVFGWVYASHMVGAGVGASVAGWIRQTQGSYATAWLLAAALCFVAAVVSLSIRRRPRRATVESLR